MIIKTYKSILTKAIFKYGINKHLSVTSSSTYKSIWRNCYNDEHGRYINYPTGNNTTLPNHINNFVRLLQQLSQTIEQINEAVYYIAVINVCAECTHSIYIGVAGYRNSIFL